MGWIRTCGTGTVKYIGGPEVPGGFVVPVLSDRHPICVVPTSLGHDHVQYALKTAAKSQHRVYITNVMYMESIPMSYINVLFKKLIKLYIFRFSVLRICKKKKKNNQDKNPFSHCRRLRQSQNL